jgi:hypothetical protein
MATFASLSAFPAAGNTANLYVAADTNDSYRWDGTKYVRISERVLSTGIEDSSEVGRAVVTAPTRRDGRLALGAAPLSNPSAIKTAAYTALPHDLVRVDASAAPVTVTLPAAPLPYTMVWVKKLDTTANTVLVQRSGGDVFNEPGGPSTIQVSAPGQVVQLYYVSGVWHVLVNSTPPSVMDDRFTPLNVRELLDFNGVPALSLKFMTDGTFQTLPGESNYVEIDRSLTNGPTVKADGPAADASLYLSSKGANGFVYIRTAAGITPTLRSSSPDANNGLNLRTVGTGVVQANSLEVATISGVQTITNKRWRPRNVTIVTAGTLDPAPATSDIYMVTGLANNLTINAPTGFTVLGEQLLFRINDNGTARTLTWNAIYKPMGVTLPTTTVAGKVLWVRCIYGNGAWDVIDVNQEA